MQIHILTRGSQEPEIAHMVINMTYKFYTKVQHKINPFSIFFTKRISILVMADIFWVNDRAVPHNFEN